MSAEQLKSVWESLGQTDPLWAVFSDPACRDGGWDLDDFMATGVRNAAWLRGKLARHGLALGPRVLDFGCGVGRLSCAIAEQGHQVVGVDIARSMVELARRYNRVPERVEFHDYAGTRVPFQDGEFDSVVSIVVLQHSPPPVQVTSLLEMLRVVRPGGLVVVQVPTRPWLAERLSPGSCQAGLRPHQVPARLGTGATATLTVDVTNRGDHEWPANAQLALGNHWRRAGAMAVLDDGRTPLRTAVRPGETVTLTVPVRAPAEPGDYALQLDMVQELVRWFAEAGSPTVDVPVTVYPQIQPPAPAAEDPTKGIEMHPMPDSLVRELVQHCGAQILHVVPDNFAGEEWYSATYLIRRE